jgi:LmbE family N-acetylglucosaminyl deacetylase
VRIAVIGAHIDDFEIACGGTVARAVAAGHAVKIIVLSDSSYARYDGTVLRTREQAWTEGHRAAEMLGVRDMDILDFPTKDIPYDSTVVEAIESRLNEFKAEVILTHWPFDTHQAHHYTGLSSLSAGRYYRSILMYEPMMPAGRSYVGFRPQMYVDISGQIKMKLDALRAHESQYQKYGDAWIAAVEARCRLRGFEMGTDYAEAFEAARFEWSL